MNELAGCKIMVVEDAYYLAMDIQQTLEEAGAVVLGPFSNISQALDGLKAEAPQCGVLDIKLGDDQSFDLARTLGNRGIPFLFCTGYDQSIIPAEFSAAPRLEKPFDGRRLIEIVTQYCLAGLKI